MVGILLKETTKLIIVACAPVVVQVFGDIYKDYLEHKRKQEEHENQKEKMQIR